MESFPLPQGLCCLWVGRLLRSLQVGVVLLKIASPWVCLRTHQGITGLQIRADYSAISDLASELQSHGGCEDVIGHSTL